jgi:hypothetical protein
MINIHHAHPSIVAVTHIRVETTHRDFLVLTSFFKFLMWSARCSLRFVLNSGTYGRFTATEWTTAMRMQFFTLDDIHRLLNC